MNPRDATLADLPAIRRGPSLGKTLTADAFAHNEPNLELFEGFERWTRSPGVAELAGVERDLVVLGLRLDGVPAPG